MSATMPQTLFYKPHGVIPTMHARSTHKAQLNEDFTAAGTSVATKIWGRWALLNKISSGSWGAYMVGNITWGAPFVALIAAVTRYTLETAITAKEALEEYNKEQEERNKASFLSAIQSRHYRSLFYQNIKNKKLGKRAIKTGIKFAFVYTAWAAATKAAAILFPLFIATAFWQVTVSIIAVTLVTALAMGLINWLTDGRTNKAFRKGGVRGAGEGVIWTFIEAMRPYTVVGQVVDILAVSLSVSGAFAASGVAHTAYAEAKESRQQVQLRHEEITRLIDHGIKKHGNLERIKATLYQYIKKEYQDQPDNQKEFAWSIVEETIKLQLLKYFYIDEVLTKDSKEEVIRACGFYRTDGRFFKVRKPKSLRLIDKLHAHDDTTRQAARETLLERFQQNAEKYMAAKPVLAICETEAPSIETVSATAKAA